MHKIPKSTPVKMLFVLFQALQQSKFTIQEIVFSVVAEVLMLRRERKSFLDQK